MFKKKMKGPFPGSSRVKQEVKQEPVESESDADIKTESGTSDEEAEIDEKFFALSNPMILFEIFRHLDIDDLKTTRLVSKLWNLESSKWLKRESVICFTEAKKKRLSDFVPHLDPKNSRETFADRAINFCLDATYLKDCKIKDLNVFFNGVGSSAKHLTYRILSRWVLIKRQDVTEGLEINLSLAKRRKFGTDILQMLYPPYCSSLQSLHIHESRVIPNQALEEKDRVAKTVKRPPIQPLPHLKELTLSNISFELYGSQIDSLLRRAVNLRKLKFVFDLESRSIKLTQMLQSLIINKPDALTNLKSLRFVDPSKQFSSGFYFHEDQMMFLVNALNLSKLNVIQFPSIRSCKGETFESFLQNQPTLQIFQWLHRNHLNDESIFVFEDGNPTFPQLPHLKEWISTNVHFGSIGFVSKMPQLTTLHIRTVSVKEEVDFNWDSFFPLHGCALDQNPALSVKNLALPLRPPDGYIGRKIVFYFPNLVTLHLNLPARRVLCSLFEEFARIDGGSLREFKLTFDLNNKMFKQFMEREKKRIGFAHLKKLEKLELIYDEHRDLDGPTFMPNFLCDNSSITHLSLSYMKINEKFFKTAPGIIKTLKEFSCTNCKYGEQGFNSTIREKKSNLIKRFTLEDDENVKRTIEKLAESYLPNLEFYWIEKDDLGEIR